MELANDIVKNLLLPKFERDSGFDKTKTDDLFWETFTHALADFETEPNAPKVLISSLGLSDSEKLISKLPELYSQFIKELAENYVLGNTNEIIVHLLQTQNQRFAKETTFYKTLEQVIKKSERKRIKADLPIMSDRLTFELSESEIVSVTKKKGREDLKAKFKQWDSEMEETEENIPVIAMTASDSKMEIETKVISKAWMKYASIAAVFIVGFLIWQPNKLSNEVLFDQYTTDDTVIRNIDYQKLEAITEQSDTRGDEILFKNLTQLETDKAMAALELYHHNNFEKSKQIFTELNVKAKNTQLLLFLATAQIKTNEVDKAVSNLEYLNTLSGYEFADEVKFYLALGYLKQNEKKKAKELLKDIVNSDRKYAKTSQEILDKIRWF